jgi:hypothetical protein
MTFHSKGFKGMLAGLFVLVASIGLQTALAEDVFKAMTGVVKSIDKGTKTMVVKTADGTEHTVKWTEKTTVEGAKDTGKGVGKASVETYDGAKEGAKLTVKYTEKAGEKTAVAIKATGKALAK